jgi:hypothetical protein
VAGCARSHDPLPRFPSFRCLPAPRELALTFIASLPPVAARMVNGGGHTLHREHCERRLRRRPRQLGRLVPIRQFEFVGDRRPVPREALKIARDEFDLAQA